MIVRSKKWTLLIENIDGFINNPEVGSLVVERVTIYVVNLFTFRAVHNLSVHANSASLSISIV